MFAMIKFKFDIIFAISLINRFAQNPNNHHLKIVKQIIRYLHSIKTRKIIYQIFFSFSVILIPIEQKIPNFENPSLIFVHAQQRFYHVIFETTIDRCFIINRNRIRRSDSNR